MCNHGCGELTTYLTNPIEEGMDGWMEQSVSGRAMCREGGRKHLPPVNSGSICTSFPSLSCARRSYTDSIDATVMKIAAVE